MNLKNKKSEITDTINSSRENSGNIFVKVGLTIISILIILIIGFGFLIFPILAIIGFKLNIMPLLYIGGITSLIISFYYYLPKKLCIDIVTILYVVLLIYSSIRTEILYLSRFEIILLVFSIGILLYTIVDFIFSLLTKNTRNEVS